MITTSLEIASAINDILCQEMYVKLTRESFSECCPHPSLAIHVTARNADEAVILSEIELAQIDSASVTGSALFIKSMVLSMGKLQRIMALFSRLGNHKRGLCYKKPVEGEVEIWFFVSLG